MCSCSPTFVFPYWVIIKVCWFEFTPRLLVSYLEDRDRIQDNKYRTISGASFPRVLLLLFFCENFLFPPLFLSRHGNRRSVRHPSSPKSPLLRVRWGVLQAFRCNNGGWCHHQSSVLALVQLPSPRGPPRHHGTNLEERDLLMSGECPARGRTIPPSSPPADPAPELLDMALPLESSTPILAPEPAPRQRPPVTAPPDQITQRIQQFFQRALARYGFIRPVAQPETREFIYWGVHHSILWDNIQGTLLMRSC